METFTRLGLAFFDLPKRNPWGFVPLTGARGTTACVCVTTEKEQANHGTYPNPPRVLLITLRFFFVPAIRVLRDLSRQVLEIFRVEMLYVREGGLGSFGRRVRGFGGEPEHTGTSTDFITPAFYHGRWDRGIGSVRASLTKMEKRRRLKSRKKEDFVFVRSVTQATTLWPVGSHGVA